MLEPVYLLQFEKEVTKSKKRGRELEKLKKVIELLVNEEPYPPNIGNINSKEIM